jgi:hypothetical protein
VSAGSETATLNVAPQALRPLSVAALKAFYYQRTAQPIEARYAGQWNRPAGHMDDHVMVHASAVSPGRPEGTIISSPGGWYDAGDYNKYIVNSAYSIAIMLMSYEQNREYFDQLAVNIPESGNRTADLLDEIMFNMKWLLTMQDPNDGGVYHKLTTPNFEGFVMPTDCHQPRYVVAKSVTATLDFAAVMAQMARLLKGNRDYSDFVAQAAGAAARSGKVTLSYDGASDVEVTVNQAAGAGAASVYTYVFTSAKWAATLNGAEANWTSGKDGGGFNNDGIQVTSNSTGANGTTVQSFTAVTKVVVIYM